MSPHGFRHTFAKHALDAGENLVTVATLMGRAGVDTTAIYTQPSERDLERAVERLETRCDALRRKAMQKWEYCVVAGGGVLGDGNVRKLTDKGIELAADFEKIRESLPKGSKLTRQDIVAQIIAQLGEDGWEMAGFDGGASSGSRALYFKRPKP